MVDDDDDNEDYDNNNNSETWGKETTWETQA